MKFPLRTVALCAVVWASGAAFAQTVVKDAWIRGTVAQQSSTGLFAQITSAQGGKLVAVSSPVAGIVEIHEMAMDGDVMKMRHLGAGLELPPGKVVELKPGSYHVMMMDLKQPLKAGDMVPVTLVVEGAGGKRESLEIHVPVKALGVSPMMEHKH